MPPMASEFSIKTPIVKVFPTPVALKVSGTCGQLLLVALVRHTMPVNWPCAKCVEMGTANRDPRSSNVTATSFFIQKSLLVLTRGAYGLIEKYEIENVMRRYRLLNN